MASDGRVGVSPGNGAGMTVLVASVGMLGSWVGSTVEGADEEGGGIWVTDRPVSLQPVSNENRMIPILIAFFFMLVLIRFIPD